MSPNWDRYKRDLDALITKGDQLHNAMQLECFPDEFKKQVKQYQGDKAVEFIKSIPRFTDEYQGWYTEAKALVRQLIPDRINDFVRLYERPKSRKELNSETYTVEDYLQGLSATRLGEKVVGRDAAIPKYRQQVAILKAVGSRFESSLFDIRLLVQGDLFDSEIGAARELLKHRFGRAAGALAGVVLERHLQQVCENHGIAIGKKIPTISDLINILKEKIVIEIPQWRFVQHLGDIRNLCDHNSSREPTDEELEDLLGGVEKVSKTLF